MPPPIPPPGQRKNLAEEVTRQLRQAIVLGEIKPGTPLAEPVLAQRYNASRAPIREALIALERDGLVEFNERSRTRVRPLTAEDFKEICSMRIALESLAARLAAQTWNAEHTRVVEENLARQETAETIGELSHLDVEMHAYIVRLSGHRRLIASWSGIRWQFEMGLAYIHRLQERLAFDSRGITVDSHRRLLSALASGKPEIAAQTMATHIEGALEWSQAEFPVEPEVVPRKSRLVTEAAKIALLLLASAAGASAVEITPEDAAFFESKVRPVLVQRCYECHSHGKKIKGGLVLDSRSGWEKGGESGPAIAPGKPDDSLLIEAVRYADKDLAMPPKAKLSDDEIATLTAWVKMGAPDPRVNAPKSTATLEEGRKHWAFQPVGHPPVPPSAFPEKSAAPIDAFLFAALAGQGLQPAGLADRTTLLRRATLDLTGLPPTFKDLSAFLADPRSDETAFATVVDRLLASPAYGEKWGKSWLDLAHYADTTGCSSDWPIDDLWRYRDWVVRAFNDDKPFDRFLTEQLAGDLLAADMLKSANPPDEKAYRENIVATGFLATAKRFGSDPGAYDYLTIGDTLDTTWKALQGLTIGCARCHDHKFDPLSTKDYYGLYGIFASSLYPYSGAEKNQNAALLVPLDPPAKAAAALDAWDRELPPPGVEPKPRSVLSIFSDRWSFEDGETSEDVTDRLPVSPWQNKGGVAVRDGNSPFTHLVPKGMKDVEFQATAKIGEMSRRVRWADESSQTRDFAIDFQLADLWDGNTHRLSLAWRPESSTEFEILRVGAQGLATREPLPIAKLRWHHLAVSYALDSATATVRLWDDTGRLLAESQASFPAAAKFRGSGDLVLRFAADVVTNKRKACVRIDNVAASSSRLPAPDRVENLAVSPPPSAPPVPPSAEEAAEIKKKAAAERQVVYDAVLPRKPETAFAMWEGTPHDVSVQKRGEPASLGAVAPRRNLELFGGQQVQQPNRESGRRDLARWLTDDINPLTLRVFVNRLWQGHFGRGIVATPNDFGHKGEPPSHPELLDFLVGRFRANGLSVKAVHREIMLSYTYRQSSTPLASNHERDPDNRWLAHFSPRRLTAEEVRDSVLAVSGLLRTDGPGYRQPFPPLSQRNWSQHHPLSMDYEGNYKAYENRLRSLYLPVLRLVADPFLSTFDGADSNQSVAGRAETAVPLQALALLNAPFVVDAANALAAVALNESSDAGAVSVLYRKTFGAEASDAMRDKLAAHLAKMTRGQAINRQEALAVIGQSLLGSNAFLHVF